MDIDFVTMAPEHEPSPIISSLGTIYTYPTRQLPEDPVNWERNCIFLRHFSRLRVLLCYRNLYKARAISTIIIHLSALKADACTWYPWWRHQMETFSASLAFCEGNPPVIGVFFSQRPVTPSFDFFICPLTNGWANNWDAGDLRRHRAHYISL